LEKCINKLTDYVIATQLSTVFAAVCVYCAHLVASGAILNDNWDFSVYVLLTVATLFMLFPHIVGERGAHAEQVDLLDFIEFCKLKEAERNQS